MTDPYQCLRCTSLAIGVWNIFGILGWQVSAVRTLQWEYEGRQLPATHAIDAYQARFPGLYAIYTETPERRRINAMFAIVLICLSLTIAHLMTSTLLLYGIAKRRPNWICPWFFTAAPMIMLCTAYAVLWWSGDVFNEQLTMSVTEFVMSLAINGPCFIVILMYYLRIKGKLTSDKPAHGRPPEFPPWPKGRPTTPPGMPAWRREWPEEPPFKLERKLRRRERQGRSRSPLRAEQRESQRRPPSRFAAAAAPQPWPVAQHETEAYRYRSTSTPLPGPQGWSTPLPGHPQPPPQAGWSRMSAQRRSRSRTPPTRRSAVMPVPQLDESPKSKALRQRSPSAMAQQPYIPPQQSAARSLLRSSSRPTTPGASLRRKSPQRVSFTKSRPKVYERTPESSLSGNDRHRELQTVV